MFRLPTNQGEAKSCARTNFPPTWLVEWSSQRETLMNICTFYHELSLIQGVSGVFKFGYWKYLYLHLEKLVDFSKSTRWRIDSIDIDCFEDIAIKKIQCATRNLAVPNYSFTFHLPFFLTRVVSLKKKLRLKKILETYSLQMLSTRQSNIQWFRTYW